MFTSLDNLEVDVGESLGNDGHPVDVVWGNEISQYPWAEGFLFPRHPAPEVVTERSADARTLRLESYMVICHPRFPTCLAAS